MADLTCSRPAIPEPRKKRPLIAQIKTRNGLAKSVAVSPPGYPDWHLKLAAALGTHSRLFLDASLRQLVAACRLPQEPATTTSVSAALELIASLKPENEAQGALAVHVACLHVASINVMARMIGGTERHTVAMATAAAKLEKAFHSALDTYQRMKSGAHQTVRVERVEVKEGGQAVIGVLRSSK
jgi:hypothetical protein